jgi:hypothetical protein
MNLKDAVENGQISVCSISLCDTLLHCINLKSNFIIFCPQRLTVWKDKEISEVIMSPFTNAVSEHVQEGPGPSVLLVACSVSVLTQCISIIFDVGVCTKSCRSTSVVVSKI